MKALLNFFSWKNKDIFSKTQVEYCVGAQDKCTNYTIMELQSHCMVEGTELYMVWNQIFCCYANPI